MDIEQKLFSTLNKQMEEQSNEDYLIKNWDYIPKDVKLFLIGKLDDHSRYKFCQINKKMAEFCRKYRLTRYDDLIKLNPDGVLIDTRYKQGELIDRDFYTTFSLVMNEETDDEDTNIPRNIKIQVLHLLFGADLGTSYYTQHGYDFESFQVNMNMIGLPPNKGSPINVMLFVYNRYDGKTAIDAFHYIDNNDLRLIIQNQVEQGYTICKLIIDNPKYFDQLLQERKFDLNYDVISLWTLPCP